MSVFELAQVYYPRLWSKERLDALLAAGKLTEEEYTALVGENSEQ